LLTGAGALVIAYIATMTIYGYLPK